jgi:hypothetical protein
MVVLAGKKRVRSKQYFFTCLRRIINVKFSESCDMDASPRLRSPTIMFIRRWRPRDEGGGGRFLAYDNQKWPYLGGVFDFGPFSMSEHA